MIKYPSQAGGRRIPTGTGFAHLVRQILPGIVPFASAKVQNIHSFQEAIPVQRLPQRCSMPWNSATYYSVSLLLGLSNMKSIEKCQNMFSLQQLMSWFHEQLAELWFSQPQPNLKFSEIPAQIAALRSTIAVAESRDPPQPRVQQVQVHRHKVFAILQCQTETPRPQLEIAVVEIFWSLVQRFKQLAFKKGVEHLVSSCDFVLVWATHLRNSSGLDTTPPVSTPID